MKPPTCILAATDLSAPARHAVERAGLLAAENGGALHVFHALELNALDSLREMLGGDLAGVRASLEEDARAQLATLVGSLSESRGVVAQTRIAVGNPLESVVAEADRLDAGLVIVGARGESFIRHALVGSTAMRLLRKSVRRPMLVVKQAPHEAYRNVLVAVDFSPASAHAIRRAQQIAPSARIILMHAYELPYEGKLVFAGVDEQSIRQFVAREGASRQTQLLELARESGLRSDNHSIRVVHGDAVEQIRVLEQEYDCDLIVLGKRGWHVAEELLLGSVTKYVLAESQCDVLVVCDHDEGKSGA